MIAIPTETCIPMGQHKTVYSEQRVYIRVRDEAAGPYLAIEGVNDEVEEGQGEHEFYLGSIGEIEDFAEICKTILNHAKRLEKE